MQVRAKDILPVAYQAVLGLMASDAIPHLRTTTSKYVFKDTSLFCACLAITTKPHSSSLTTELSGKGVNEQNRVLLVRNNYIITRLYI